MKLKSEIYMFMDTMRDKCICVRALNTEHAQKTIKRSRFKNGKWVYVGSTENYDFRKEDTRVDLVGRVEL